MKNPNGYGCVYKLSGNRRKPWAVRLSNGYRFDDEGNVKRKYTHLGSFETRKEAMNALALYNANPKNIKANKTFEAIYEEWSAKHFETVSDSMIKQYRLGFKWSTPLHKKKMKDITIEDIETLSSNMPLDKTSISGLVANLLSALYKYSVLRDYCDKDLSQFFTRLKGEKKIKRIPYNIVDIKKVSADNSLTAKMILLGVYTGFRPSELCTIKRFMVDMDNWTIKHGIKTESGIGRIVPVHTEVRDLVEELCKGKNENDLLFDTTYPSYAYQTKLIIKRLGLCQHNPHDTRHTFITYAKECGFDEYCLKLIVGHAITDLTERVYTHRTIEVLHAEMSKLNLS